ncbi:MAG: S41 family peptidase [Candidatus Gracilibacteria bacterium]
MNIKKILGLTVAVLTFSTLIPQALSYTDVTSSNKYYEEINFLESKGLLPATSGTFEPEKKITPPEFYEMLMTFAEVDIVEDSEIHLPYTDIDSSNPYAKYIQTALNYKILNPSLLNPTLRPNKIMRKREVLIKLFDTLGVGVNKLFNVDEFPFRDLALSGTSAPYFFAAYNLGIKESDPSLALASKQMTKADIANILYEIYQSANNNNVNISIDMSGGNTIDHPTFDIFVDVWNTIKEKYYFQEEIDEKEMLYNAIEGVVNTLTDPYTVFSTPDETNVAQTLDSEYEGVGMSVEIIDDQITIITPFKDSPAEAAGLEPNDVITKVDGTSVSGLSLETVVDMIKGTAGTTVKLTIKRDSKTLEFTVTRGYIFYQTVSLEFIEKNNKYIAYLNVVSFGDETYNEFVQAAQQIHDKQQEEGNVLGIILDLRNNPGGYLDTAIEMTGFFFDENKDIVILEDSQGSETTYYAEYYGEENEYDYGAGLLSEYETVVLVNDGSASASEIMAGALQDYKRAKIIGEKTFGKGTVQELLFYNDDSVFKLTISKWLTPKGRDINKSGVTPDEVVTNSSSTTDTQLEEAKKEF